MPFSLSKCFPCGNKSAQQAADELADLPQDMGRHASVAPRRPGAPSSSSRRPSVSLLAPAAPSLSPRERCGGRQKDARESRRRTPSPAPASVRSLRRAASKRESDMSRAETKHKRPTPSASSQRERSTSRAPTTRGRSPSRADTKRGRSPSRADTKRERSSSHRADSQRDAALPARAPSTRGSSRSRAEPKREPSLSRSASKASKREQSPARPAAVPAASIPKARSRSVTFGLECTQQRQAETRERAKQLADAFDADRREADSTNAAKCISLEMARQHTILPAILNTFSLGGGEIYTPLLRTADVQIKRVERLRSELRGRKESHLVDMWASAIYWSNKLDQTGLGKKETGALVADMLTSEHLRPLLDNKTPLAAEAQSAIREFLKNKSGQAASSTQPRRRQEVANHVAASFYLANEFGYRGRPLSLTMIRNAHLLLQMGIDHETPAETVPYQKHAGVFWGSDKQAVERQVKRFAGDLSGSLTKAARRQTIDPFYIAAKACADFDKLSPFLSANAKMSRLISNAILFRYTGIFLAFGGDDDGAKEYRAVRSRLDARPEKIGGLARYVQEAALATLGDRAEKFEMAAAADEASERQRARDNGEDYEDIPVAGGEFALWGGTAEERQERLERESRELYDRQDREARAKLGNPRRDHRPLSNG